jgi:uncharacterized RDD family membrane protein YckC
MENGSSARPSNGDANLNGAGLNGHGPSRDGELPLSARLLGVGVRGVRGVGKATGIDRAVELAAEEAIVGAIESEAVERAMARLLHGPVVGEAIQGALESDQVKRAILEAMDSELVDEVWRRLLASEEAQQLVERIAGAPELRAAISAQGMGLLDDIARTISRLASRLDDTVEVVARRILFRRHRQEQTKDAGAVSRAIAFAIDAVFVNLGFTATAALVTLADNAFGGSATGGSVFAVAVGSTAWLAIGSAYMTAFWALAGQTPGMRFLGIRLAGGRLPFGRCVRRLVGLYFSFVTLGFGFLGILTKDRRRGWADRLAGTEVVYEERRPAPAPWSVDPLGGGKPAPVDPAAAPVVAAETEPAAAAPAAAAPVVATETEPAVVVAPVAPVGVAGAEPPPPTAPGAPR